MQRTLLTTTTNRGDSKFLPHTGSSQNKKENLHIIIIIDKDMNALVGFIALVVIAIAGWVIAEFKYKAFTFTRSEKDIEEEKELEEMKRADGFKEMNIRDIMRKNSTNGYNAVG